MGRLLAWFWRGGAGWVERERQGGGICCARVEEDGGAEKITQTNLLWGARMHWRRGGGVIRAVEFANAVCETRTRGSRKRARGSGVSEVSVGFFVLKGRGKRGSRRDAGRGRGGRGTGARRRYRRWTDERDA